MHEPTPQEVRELRARHGLSQAALGALVHVQARSVQRWEAEVGQARQMPAGLWELALAKLGEGKLERYAPPKPRPRPKPKPKRRRARPTKRRKIRKAAPVVVKPDKPKPMTAARLKALREMAARSFGLTPRL